MDEETLAGAKRFQDWMDKEEIRIKNNHTEIILPIKKKLPLVRQNFEFKRPGQLKLF